MLRLALVAGLAGLLAGCGGSRDKDVPTDTAITGNQDCSKKPDFVPIHADAKVTLCSAGHVEATGKDSGTILYTSAAAPAALLAASKEHAAKAGLAEQLSTPEMFSSAEGDKRTVMVMAAPQGTGSQVTVNWGRQR